MKKFLLRLDENLFDDVSKIAQEQGISLNKYINDVLIEKVNEVKDTNFEKRNIVGTLIKGTSIVEDKELLEVAGIYYKYKLTGSTKVDKDSFYEIVKAIGNVIYIKKEEND